MQSHDPGREFPRPPTDVSAIFSSYPAAAREKLLAVRNLILETAEATGTGPLTETLKWGEPAYLTEKTRSGSTIRLGWKQAKPEYYALYFICHTNLLETFRTLYPDTLHFEGNRAITLNLADPVPTKALGHCVALALTYHRKNY